MSYYLNGKRIGNVVDMVSYITEHSELFERICDDNDINVWTRNDGYDWDLTPIYDWLIDNLEAYPGMTGYGITYVDDGLDNKKPRTSSYNEMEWVRKQWSKQKNLDPKVLELSKKQDVKDFVADHWEFIKWDNHGNEPALDEIVGSHGSYIEEVTGKADSQYIAYSISGGEPFENLDNRQKDLLTRLFKLNDKYRNFNKRPKSPKQKSGIGSKLFRRL